MYLVTSTLTIYSSLNISNNNFTLVTWNYIHKHFLLYSSKSEKLIFSMFYIFSTFFKSHYQLLSIVRPKVMPLLTQDPIEFIYLANL